MFNLFKKNTETLPELVARKQREEKENLIRIEEKLNKNVTALTYNAFLNDFTEYLYAFTNSGITIQQYSPISVRLSRGEKVLMVEYKYDNFRKWRLDGVGAWQNPSEIIVKINEFFL